jgi:hypothetical protein
MEPFLISKVEDIVRITGRPLYVFPGLPKGGPPSPIRVGDQIELRRPDGTVLKTDLAGIEHAKGVDGNSYWPLGLPPETTEADVPSGTEIWRIALGANAPR